jgi:uncharacterized membrane protein
MVSLVVGTNVLGNFLMSWGVKHELIPPGLLGPVLILFNPWVAAGVALLILWMLSRMALLSWADLSYVLPVTSFGYVLNALLGRFALGEQVSAQRWAGTLLIIAGTMLVGLGSHSTAAEVES